MPASSASRSVSAASSWTERARRDVEAALVEARASELDAVTQELAMRAAELDAAIEGLTAALPAAERAAAIARDPAYGKIVCRCETVSEAEIRAAIRCRIGARTLDGVKRRTRAGMGRCQGGFCTPRIIAILCEELGLEPEGLEQGVYLSTDRVSLDLALAKRYGLCLEWWL